MNFNTHGNLAGKHAFLGASKYQWVNYDEDKLRAAYENWDAAQRGTIDHAFAAECIKRKQRLWKSKQTIALFVNDAIGFGMEPEVTLYYTDNCFGTTDAIVFDEKPKFLRIHDFKTGRTPAHMEQLLVYEALFCLEYGFDPRDIQSELRIYQFNDYISYAPEPEKDIMPVMKAAIRYDKLIEKWKKGDL